MGTRRLVTAAAGSALLVGLWHSLRVPDFPNTLVETAQLGGAVSDLELRSDETVRVRYGDDDIVLNVSHPDNILAVEPATGAARSSLYRAPRASADAPAPQPADKVVRSGPYEIRRTAGAWSVHDLSIPDEPRRIGLPRSVRNAADIVAGEDRIVIAESDGRVLVLAPGELREDHALGAWYGVAQADAVASDGRDLYFAAPIGSALRSSVSRVDAAAGVPRSGLTVGGLVDQLTAAGGAVAGGAWIGDFPPSYYAFVLARFRPDSMFWSPCHLLDGRSSVALAAGTGAAPRASVGCGSVVHTTRAAERPRRTGTPVEIWQDEKARWGESELGDDSAVTGLAQGSEVAYAAVGPEYGPASMMEWTGVVAVRPNDSVAQRVLRTPELLQLVSDGEWLYALSNDGRLIVMDVSEPLHPRSVATMGIERTAGSRLRRGWGTPRSWAHGWPILTAAGGQLLVAYPGWNADIGGLEAFVFDVSDPRHPRQTTGSVAICSATSAVAVPTRDGADFVVACSQRSVAVYRSTELSQAPTPVPTNTPVPSPTAVPSSADAPPSVVGYIDSESSSFGLVSFRNCSYDMELDWDDASAIHEVGDVSFTVRSKRGEELPHPDKFSAWQLKTGYDAARFMDGGQAPRAAVAEALAQSPDAIRLLVSGSAADGDYVVEGVTLEPGPGVWYLLVEVETKCGSDYSAYSLARDRSTSTNGLLP